MHFVFDRLRNKHKESKTRFEATIDEAFARHVEELDEREKKIARRSADVPETTSNQSLSSSSSSGANRADSNVHGVHEQDADMNNDDKEKTGHVNVSRNRNRKS